MATAGGFSKKKAKTLVKNLDTEVLALNKALRELEKDLVALQEGDVDGPYWNGARAYTWVKTALANLDHNKVLLDHIDNISDYLSGLVNGADAL